MNLQNKKTSKLKIAEYKDTIDRLSKENKTLKDTIEQKKYLSEFAALFYRVDKELKNLKIDKTLLYELQVNAYPSIKEEYLKYMIKQQMQCLN